jgi:hypothetical protein
MNLTQLLIFTFTILSYTIQAQCPNSTPGFLSGTWNNILSLDTTTAPIYTTAPTGLPNTEFVVIQNDSMASDGLGPKIIFSSLDGRIVPNDLGLLTCNEICIVPFSYDLNQLKTIVDSLYGAMYLPGTTCCDAAGQFFVGVCDSLSVNGINSGADVTNLNDVIVLMGIIAGTTNGSTSLFNLTTTIDQLNGFMTLFGPCSGGVTEVCYSVADSAAAMDCYTLVEPNSSTFVDVTQDTVWMAPGDSSFLAGTFLPNSSIDTLTWYNSDPGSGISVDAVSGLVIAGSIADTAWIYAKAIRGCLKDFALVIVSPALSIRSYDMTETVLNVAPNPFNKSVNVSFYAEEGDYKLQLIDITGRLCHSESYFLNRGNQLIELSTESINKGYYFLRIIGRNTQGIQAIIKN